MAGTYTETLTATTFVVDRNRLPIPCSIGFRSADAGRKIELSLDNGTEYFTPVYDVNTATMLAVSLLAPALVKVTGAIGDVVVVTSDSKRVP